MTETISKPELVRLAVDPDDREIWPDGVQVAGVMFGEHLAVTPGLDRDHGFSGRWGVTHVPTGQTIHVSTMCIGCAERAATIAVTSGVDWGAPKPELLADAGAKEVAKTIREIALECENDDVCERAFARFRVTAPGDDDEPPDGES